MGYAVIELDDKAFCLLFNDIISLLKVYNMCPIKHVSRYLQHISCNVLVAKNQWSEKLQNLKQNISSQQNFFMKVKKKEEKKTLKMRQ